MTDDPRAAISAALTQADSAALTQADPAVPFRVLDHAAAWATDLVPGAQLDDAVAFECVVALDDALLPLSKLFQLIPELVRAASPGGVVSRQEEAEQLRAEQRQSLPALDARRQADDELVAGLGTAGLIAGSSGLERVRDELASIAERLANVEGALAPLLQQQSQAYADARRPTSWSG